jgi:drug/metabolite transporter (DMT)-like permease
VAIRRRDLLIACAAAVGFASKGIFAKLLYARGWDPDSVLTVRALVALPFVCGFALWRTGLAAILRMPLGAVAGAAAAGAFCYSFGAVLNFHALALIPAGVERVLLFSYPSMVVLLQALVRRRMPSPRVLAAVALTYGGILLVVGGVDLASLRADLYGAGLVLVCALTFAVYYLASDRWTPAAGSAAFTVVALASATALLVLWDLARHGRVATVHGDLAGALLMAGLVLFATVMPMLMMTEGVRRLGAQRSAVASTIGPPATLAMGALFLGERLGGLQWAGALLIIAGIVVLQTDPAPRDR